MQFFPDNVDDGEHSVGKKTYCFKGLLKMIYNLTCMSFVDGTLESKPFDHLATIVSAFCLVLYAYILIF